MTLPIKLTKEKEWSVKTQTTAALRSELVQLEERINDKIRKITWTHQKMPYDRMVKGRRLKECCLGAISYLDEGNELKLQEAIRELLEAGIKLSSL